MVGVGPPLSCSTPRCRSWSIDDLGVGLGEPAAVIGGKVAAAVGEHALTARAGVFPSKDGVGDLDAARGSTSAPPLEAPLPENVLLTSVTLVEAAAAMAPPMVVSLVLGEGAVGDGGAARVDEDGPAGRTQTHFP